MNPQKYPNKNQIDITINSTKQNKNKKYINLKLMFNLFIYVFKEKKKMYY